jgi:hypothetical protein
MRIAGAVLVIVVAIAIYLAWWFDNTDFEPRSRAIRIEHEAASELTIEAFADWTEWVRVPTPGREPRVIVISAAFGDYSRIGRNVCTMVPLRAIDAAGREVDRHPPPLCDGDTWVIHARDD